MRKFMSLVLCSILFLSLFSCAGRTRNRMGVGIYTDLASDRSAIGGNDGHTKYVHTVAAITEDKDGRITACDIDVVEILVEFTATGKAKIASEYKTKGQLGDEYGMKKAGAKLEWYEQRDAFCKSVIGKTVDEIKGAVAEDGKGSGFIISAGCTVKVDDFVRAIVKADENAEPVSARVDKLKLTLTAETEGKDATDTDVGVISSKTGIKVDADGMDSIEKSADFKVWFSKTGILQPEPDKKIGMKN